MSDLKNYIERRKQSDSEFAEGLESGYMSFKIGVLLRQAREAIGMTQEEVAARLNLDKSAVVQIETQPESASLSALERYAEVVGKTLCVEIN